jgi:hypothetical protein
MAAGLKKLGFQFQIPEAAFYFCVKVPGGLSSGECVAGSWTKPASWSRRATALLPW